MRVNTTLLIVFVTLLAKASAAEDLYLEGEDDANEFLEVDRDTGIGGHLQRLRRDGFWDWFQPTSPKPEEAATEDNELIDEDNDLNGGSGAVEPESEPEKEKTLRVTFVVMEPYRDKYSNRDSPQFQNFSRSLAEAVNTVFRDLPGTHRASLVRIQSRPADEFTCKVTLDIVVTGDDTSRVSETLREYIRNRRKLGNVTVYDVDYSATVIDSGNVDNEAISQSEDQYNVPERGDGIPDTTELPDLLETNEDNIFGERPIGVEVGETTEEIIPNGGENDYERPTEDTPLFVPEDDRAGYGRTTEGRPDYERTTEGRSDDGRLNEGRNGYGRPDERRPDGGNVYGGPTERRPDYENPTEGRPDNRGQAGYESYTGTPGGWRNNTCPDNFMSCDETRCVPLSQRCDDRRDCDDGADEMGCPDKSCGADDFRCNNGKCIENNRRCNRQVDCPSGEDEMNCDCRSDEFRCEDDGSCIENRKRCNGYKECRDGSDELDCGGTACGPDSFTCDAGSRVRCATKCDDYPECDNGEDEDGCQDECNHECDGICLQDVQICDGNLDCADGSDEIQCNDCDGPNDFRCNNGVCINAAQHCNGEPECDDGSDELNCNVTMISEPYGCLDNQFQCRDGGCVNNQFFCDGHADCNDNSDEENCPCNEGEWQCVSGQCIPVNGYCDGVVDCTDASDERDCPTTYRPFTTAYPAYPYPPTTTQRPIFTTTSNAYEGGPNALNLKTYPVEQTVRYVNTGGDVVFSCRDEGTLRAPVRWIREGGRPLKPGSTDRNGRLEISGVTPADSGVYICQAPRYIGHPRSQIQVVLTVERSPVTSRPPFMLCPTNQATCANGQCILRSAICDGNQDCADGSDEESCYHNGMCEPNEYQCANRKCVLKTWLCDAEDDCGDESDEQNCGQPVPGQQCLPVEYACATNNQCIPKTFHCDGQSDCFDKSDEIGCAPVYVTRPPSPSNLKLNPGDTLTLRCEAVGVPTPLISWRLNWGNVPEKCTSTSSNGTGVLTCPNMQSQDSGAYSCEAINNRRTIFAAPDAIVYVNRTADVCPSGYFNSEARSESECIRCFCFGKSTQCQSADLFIFNMPTPLGEGGTRLVGVSIGYNGAIQKDEDINNQYYYQPLRNGATVTKLDQYGAPWTRNSQAHAYLTLPESYNGNQLTSYGGSIKYRLSPHTFQPYAERESVPDIIILGKYQDLVHFNRAERTRELYIDAHLTPEYWQKPSSNGLIPASREDIMMTLDAIEMILLRADLNNAGANITEFTMVSAQLLNVGLGAASLVEECECPKGYKGRSCEKCADGYELRNSGPWNGVCVAKAPTCPPMTYGDPNYGGECRACPCPLTNRGNQFASGCSIGPSGNVVCNCLPGYEGPDCSYCAPNYLGNPLMPGDSCKPKPQDNCDPIGTVQVRVPDECVCKENVQGRYCDQCKNGSFFLSNDFKNGCALCFCSGIPPQNCVSSTLRRKTTRVRFNVPTVVDQLKVYNSAPIGPGEAVRYITPVDTGLRPALVRGEVNINSVTRSEPSIFYWGLQDSFAGDKVTSYGGYLTYQLRNVQPNPSYRNTAADVQLVSDNSLTFLYFGKAMPTSDGYLNASVQFIESSEWQRSDGRPVTREHFLLALADVKTILIKATYSSDTDIASIDSASIETADEYGDGPMAQHVEQCMCPPGYVGTSCEDCAPGYTRSLSGLYLRHCVPCDCNGHSNKCHPETGECFECNDNTQGPNCEYCRAGYEQDQANNCVPTSPTPRPRSCNCDSRGLEKPCDESGNCKCKQNVEGEACDRCRPGTFGLDAGNPLGCTACYCSAVATDCHEATHYARITLPASVFGENYGGYTLMDINAERVINDQFVPVVNESELMYVFSDQPIRELYWSLPVFPGNRVLSYNGTLSLTQEFEVDPSLTGYPDESVPGTDVVLVGERQSIFWSNPTPIRSGEALSYQVPLRENKWFNLNSFEPTSRSIFMSVLKNLKRVLVRATLVQQNIITTSIADVSMDSAEVSYDPSSRAAKGIEECMCPEGFTGTSCESCTLGYYKDRSDYCRQCNCNGHDCQLGIYDEIVCNCRPPYTGPDCSTVDTVTDEYELTTRGPIAESTVVVRIRQPKIQIQEVGGTVNFTCQARSQMVRAPLQVEWYKADGNLPQGRSQVDSRTGLLLITNLQVSDSGTYICQTTDGISTQQDIATLKVPGNDMTAPTVSVSPSMKEYLEGSRIEITCTATGNPAPRITWQRASNRALPSNSEVYESLLIIENAGVEDSGDYRCIATNPAGSTDRTAVITVRAREPAQNGNLTVSSQSPTLNEGQSTRVVCTGTTDVPAGTLDWVRQDGTQFSSNVRADNGVLYIDVARIENEGVYICQTAAPGVKPVLVVLSVIPQERIAPNITLSTNVIRIPTGGRGEVECFLNGDPMPLAKWTKHLGTFGPGTSQRDNTLIITNAQESDLGYYLCEGNIDGKPVVKHYVFVDIEKREKAQVVIYPQAENSATLGSEFQLNCYVTGGNPAPVVTWNRAGGRALSPSVEILQNNVLKFRNVEVNDEGEYTCTATNSAGSVSASAILKVRSPPVIRILPDSYIKAYRGDSVNVECRADGYPEPQVSIKSSSDLRVLVPSKPRIASLYIPSLSDSDDGIYLCTASSAAGTIEEQFAIRVERGDASEEPDIGSTPTVLRAIERKETRIGCNASNEFYVVWGRADRKLLQPNAKQIGNELVIYNTSKSDSGKYECTLINRRTEEVQQSAYTSLQVIAPPKITLIPPTQTVHPGQSPTVECLVEGDDITEIFWRPYNYTSPSSRVEYRGSTLIFRQIEVEDAGKYECIALNSIANATGIAEVIVSEDTDRATSESYDNEQIAHLGAAVHLRCNVSQPNVRIRWTKNGRPVPRTVNQKTDGSLFIRLAQKSDSGRYVCHIRDVYGRQTTNYINLHIEGPRDVAETLVTIDQPRRTYRVGERVEVLCRGKSRDVSVKWERYGTNQYVESITYGDGALLHIPEVQVLDAGLYRCTGEDRYGLTSYDDFYLEVVPGQSRPMYPTSERDTTFTVRLGDIVDLPCNHNLEEPVYYEWKREYSQLPLDMRQNDRNLHFNAVTEADAGTYVCRVTNNRARVETKATLRVIGLVPKFNGDGWVALPTLKDAYLHFDIEISFKPSDQNGVILFNAQNNNGTGDYLILQLVEGAPELTVKSDTATPLKVTGDRPLQLNVWHTIRLSRSGSKVTMDVDNTGPFVAELSDPYAVLDLNAPLYIGGAPDQRPPELAQATGFVGCVSMLILGKEEIVIMDNRNLVRNVFDCDSCNPNQCLNGGVCQEARNERGYTCLCATGFAGLNCDRPGEACRPGLCGPGKCTDTLDGYKCACPVTFTGKNCDVKQNIDYPAFTGSAYLAIKPPNTSRFLRMSMKVKAKAPVTDGIIMYCAQSPRGYGGFTSLAVRDGRLEFRYDVGDGNAPIILTSNEILQPNEWTDVRIARVGHEVYLRIGMIHNYEATFASAKDLNLETPMFVGGVDDSIILNNNTGVTGGFYGCIKDVTLHGDQLDLINDSIQSANVQECDNILRGDIPEMESFCSECRNGGYCENADSVSCTCPSGFIGVYCDRRAPVNRPQGDPCAGQPCQNGGTCRADRSSTTRYSCDCPLGYTGNNCVQQLELLQSVAFEGNGYLALSANYLQYDQISMEPVLIALAFNTRDDGVLLYQHEEKLTYGGDYILLRVNNSVVVVDWDLGGGKSSLSIPVLVTDEERHQVIVKLYENGLLELTVDKDTRSAASSGISNVMNADSSVYIGGIPDYLNTELNYPGFRGCVEQVEFSGGRSVNLRDAAVGGKNTERCKKTQWVPF